MGQPQQDRKKRRRWRAVGAFLKTVPGLLTAIATTLTAVAGILATLAQLGVVQVRSPIVVGSPPSSTQVGTPIGMTAAGAAPTTAGAPLSGNNGLATVYLGDLSPTDSSNYAGSNVQADMDGQPYRHSLLFYTCCGQATADYNLGRHYQRLEATLGVNDEAPFDAESTFEVFLDGRKVYTRTVKFGDPTNLKLDVANVLRLHIVMTSSGGSFRAVWGDARLLGAMGEVPGSDTTGTTDTTAA